LACSTCWSSAQLPQDTTLRMYTCSVTVLNATMHVLVYMYVLSQHVCVCMYVYVCIYIYTCMYKYIHTYICIQHEMSVQEQQERYCTCHQKSYVPHAPWGLQNVKHGKHGKQNGNLSTWLFNLEFYGAASLFVPKYSVRYWYCETIRGCQLETSRGNGSGRRMYAGAFKLETVVGTPRLLLGVIRGYPVVHPPACE
jgi:hypothetical protein